MTKSKLAPEVVKEIVGYDFYMPKEEEIPVKEILQKMWLATRDNNYQQQSKSPDDGDSPLEMVKYCNGDPDEYKMGGLKQRKRAVPAMMHPWKRTKEILRNVKLDDILIQHLNIGH